LIKQAALTDPNAIASPASRRGRLPCIARLSTIAAALLAFGVGAAFAADVAAGRQKAVQCQACHGLDGLSKLPEAPHIAGQPEPYLLKALNDYRKGVRKNEFMSLVVQQLNDRDVADIAAYYAAIEVTVKLPK
jgi:cytochrome c553